jgi:hypothetical protein
VQTSSVDFTLKVYAVSNIQSAQKEMTMGAWSHEPFGNDDAGDWAYGLDESRDLGLIEWRKERATGKILLQTSKRRSTVNADLYCLNAQSIK